MRPTGAQRLTGRSLVRPVCCRTFSGASADDSQLQAPLSTAGAGQSNGDERRLLNPCAALKKAELWTSQLDC